MNPDDELLSGDRYHVFSLRARSLPDDRSVLVYLPACYATESDRRFPVFYLHDGQNVFDGRTSYIPGQTWRAHVSADRLTRSGSIEPLILVGVGNTGLRRMAEYTPTRDLRMGGGEGRSYGQLLVDELKPRIDQRFRTRTGPEDTGVGGSSLGGLISLFLGLTHPRVFGKVAVMSPSLWWDQRSILNLVSRTEANPRFRLWLDMGTAEGTRHLRDADMLYRMLLGRGWTDGRDLKYRRVEGGLHNEQAWADRFGEVLQFLFPASADRALAVAETA